MSTELMIPEAGNVPAYIRNQDLARQANEDAAAGISTGFPPQVKLSNGKFALQDGNGDKTPYPQAKLIHGPDGNVYLPEVVLRAKKDLQKKWYASAYNPNATEFKAPDCFSSDGVRPDASVAAPQCDVCANCPLNAFGSGKDQNGNPTKGKACSDSKILAVFVPGFGIYEFDIPPGSLKNWGLYVKQLTSAGIPVGAVKTLVGFDPTVTTSILIFRFGGFIGEDALPRLAQMSVSQEVEEIVNQKPAAAAAPPAAAKPQPVETVETSAADLGLDDTGEAEAKAAEERAKAEKAAKTKAEKAAKAKAEKDAKEKATAEAAAAAATSVDDLGLDGVATPEAKQEAPAAATISDAQLAADLGLDF